LEKDDYTPIGRAA